MEVIIKISGGRGGPGRGPSNCCRQERGVQRREQSVRCERTPRRVVGDPRERIVRGRIVCQLELCGTEIVQQRRRVHPGRVGGRKVGAGRFVIAFLERIDTESKIVGVCERNRRDVRERRQRREARETSHPRCGTRIGHATISYVEARHRGSRAWRPTLRIGTLRGILHDIDVSPVEFSERWTA